MTVQRLSHIGICVSDLERSVRFYRDVLGFEEMSRLQVKGAEAERLLQLAGGELQAVYLQRDGTRIELLFYFAIVFLAQRNNILMKVKYFRDKLIDLLISDRLILTCIFL